MICPKDTRLVDGARTRCRSLPQSSAVSPFAFFRIKKNDNGVLKKAYLNFRHCLRIIESVGWRLLGNSDVRPEMEIAYPLVETCYI